MTIFSHAEYATLVNETVETINKLSTLKGGEYAGDVDRLANFRRNGVQMELPMETIWSVYYNKHHDAVMQYVRDLQQGRKRERLESIEGRLDDMIVYCILFKAMVRERNRPINYGQLLSQTILTGKPDHKGAPPLPHAIIDTDDEL